MKPKLILLGVLIAIVGTACTNQKHFISDENIRQQVEEDFQAKQKDLPNGDLFDVFNGQLTLKERGALMFLYAYLPIGDIADYSGEYYLKNIRSSFSTQKEMTWGSSIPEEVFRHFVLPVRVNNENLDYSRISFYEELKNRVKDLSLYDAVLEVNHWCHEKVIYTPSDSRTCSPLASVKAAQGRCGEESVFTVAALRSVGIPARQVYTPRWAHTDSNHAWVEAWVDGQWYFLGACEPEPVLNRAWFNDPASRGMLMHAKVFGRYNGPEEMMEKTRCYTEVNVTANYAPTALSTITVTDAQGNPVEDALVEFKIYNYAEFYTVARKYSDETGKTSLVAGKGDMIVWASKNNRFGFKKVSFGNDEQVTIQLDKQPGDDISLDFDIVPPISTPIPAQITPEQKSANDLRLQKEDSIRNSYTATFCDEKKALDIARQINIDVERIAPFLIQSRGNWSDIQLFLSALLPEQVDKAIKLLGAISTKDLLDTSADNLNNHLLNTPDIDSEYYASYILNPRVSNELLSPYRSFFEENIDREQAEQFAKDPKALIEWVAQNVRIDDALNPQRIPILPIGVWKARVADTRSRDIFFVALARTLSIPSRIDPVTGKVQYVQNGSWIDVDFKASAPVYSTSGKVNIVFPKDYLVPIEYRQHFTIGKIHPDGQLQTLDFSKTKTGISELEVGNYLLTSGTRMAKGNTLVHVQSLHIASDKTVARVNLIMREDNDDIQVIGSMDPEAEFLPVGGNEKTSILATVGRGYFIIGVLGSRQEPTNHAMQNLASLHSYFNDWGRGIVVLFKDEADWKNFDPKEFNTLPNTITYGIDTDNITQMIADAMRLPNTNTLPIFIIADTFGRVVFVSQGYTIGVGEQMMKVIQKL